MIGFFASLLLAHLFYPLRLYSDMGLMLYDATAYILIGAVGLLLRARQLKEKPPPLEG